MQIEGKLNWQYNVWRKMGMAYIDKIKERARQDKKTIVLPESLKRILLM